MLTARVRLGQGKGWEAVVEGPHCATEQNILHFPNDPPSMLSCLKVEQACVNRRACGC